MMRMLALCGLLALVAAGPMEDADDAYRRGDYRAAAEAYARVLAGGDSSAVVRYNLGTALLRLGRYDEARPHLRAAAGPGAPPGVAGRAAYNAGNTDLAPVAAGSVPKEQRRERLLRAIGHYRRALMLDPEGADARWNLELAQRLLREDAGGGGGEDEQEDEQPQGGGGEGPPSPAAPQPQPGQASGGGTQPMARARAERILAGAEAREQAVQREQLKRDQARIHGVRDW